MSLHSSIVDQIQVESLALQSKKGSKEISQVENLIQIIKGTIWNPNVSIRSRLPPVFPRSEGNKTATMKPARTMIHVYVFAESWTADASA